MELLYLEDNKLVFVLRFPALEGSYYVIDWTAINHITLSQILSGRPIPLEATI